MLAVPAEFSTTPGTVSVAYIGPDLWPRPAYRPGRGARLLGHSPGQKARFGPGDDSRRTECARRSRGEAHAGATRSAVSGPPLGPSVNGFLSRQLLNVGGIHASSVYETFNEPTGNGVKVRRLTRYEVTYQSTQLADSIR